MVELHAADGHALSAYRALPAGEARGGIVVVQEIFGVNAHVRAVCDGYAAEGYAAIAPALFDRIERGVELPYDAGGVTRGRALRTELGWEKPIADVEAAIAAVRAHGRVATIGFCWGGSLSFLAACRTSVDAAVAYYGGQIVQFVKERPRVPVMMHFGDRDALIPEADRATIARTFPEAEIHLYAADHGFNCDQREVFDAASAALARERTLAFLGRHLGGDVS
jgi:carboxymethylenebutenolidase